MKCFYCGDEAVSQVSYHGSQESDNVMDIHLIECSFNLDVLKPACKKCLESRILLSMLGSRICRLSTCITNGEVSLKIKEYLKKL